VEAAGNVAALVQELGSKKPVILTDPGVIRAGLLESVKASLEKAKIAVEIIDGCQPDAPLKAIQECARRVKEGSHDLIIAVGGGSVMDTAKAVSVLAATGEEVRSLLGTTLMNRTGLAKILIPTTAGTGSEWSGAAAVTDETDGQKKIVRGRFTWAERAIIDPLLTLNLPPRVTADTGMDALCHAIEAYVTWKANIISDMFAEKSIQLINRNLRQAYAKGSKHVETRYEMAIAAALAMQAGMASGLGLVHAMNYPVAMKAHLSHGASIGILLPHVMEFNLLGNAEKYAKIAHFLGEDISGLSGMDAAHKAVEAVRKLSRDLGMMQKMREGGFEKEDIPGFVEYLFQFMPYGLEINPRDLTREEAAEIFEAAW
jgi:alcohol dehydrogenase class IV